MNSRYHAHPNGYLTIDNDPTPVLFVKNWAHPDGSERAFAREATTLSELASDGNHAREWAARAARIQALTDPFGRINTAQLLEELLREMAEYHRDGGKENG